MSTKSRIISTSRNFLEKRRGSSTVLIRKGGKREEGGGGGGCFREKDPFHSANPEFPSNNYVPQLFDSRSSLDIVSL